MFSSENSCPQETKREKIGSFCSQLEEFLKTEGLVISGVESTFNTGSLCDDDEIWLMEIPKSVREEKGVFIFIIFFLT